VSDRSLDLARHATITALAAVTLDAIYTAVYWLILGRNQRRISRHPVLRYFGVILQLSAETAVILHLLSRMKRAA
jgi:hypothetical protein